MSLFDISKYEIPANEEVDMVLTKRNFEIFIGAYKSSREKIGQPRVPKVTQSYSLIPPSTAKGHSGEAERLLIQKEEDLAEFEALHQLFSKGFSVVAHPFKAEVTERRRQIFVLRYLQGLTVNEIMERAAVSKDIVTDESKEAMLQFSTELQLVVKKSESTPPVACHS
ncbi:ArpU family phage packaging/lysis transcriptional regulator [Enterococcus innesii]|uniref:ArpU family phage packaging/lysis transcriptional regulator n=1 Tax=Enterococcus innesii TaxID=2839759 RepID=UPI003B5B6713